MKANNADFNSKRVEFGFKGKNIPKKPNNAAKIQSSKYPYSSDASKASQVYFKGGLLFRKRTEKSGIKELTNAEFEQKRKEVLKKIDTLPDNIKKKFDDIEFDKYNIFIAEKILNSDELLQKTKVIRSLEYIIPNDCSKEDAEAKCQIIDKILNTEELCNNDSISSNFGNIIYRTNFKDEADAKDYLIDEILKDKKAINNENIMNSIGQIIASTDNKKDAKAKLSIMKKILSDEKLYKNTNVAGYIGEIISNTTAENIGAKFDIIEKIFKDKKLYNNDSIMNHLGNIIYGVNSKYGFNATSIILDNEKFRNNESLINNMERITLNVNSQRRFELLEKIFNDFDSLQEKGWSAEDTALFISNSMSSEAIESLNYTKKFDKLAEDAVRTIVENKNIDESEINIEQIEGSLRKALKCPRQYLSHIPSCTTEKVLKTHKYKMEELPSYIDNEYKKRIINFFSNNMEQIIKLYKYLDSDTMNTMMDKRTEKFAEDLDNLSKISDNNLELLKDLLNNCKTYKAKINGNLETKNLSGSGKRKVELCEKIHVLQALFGQDLKENPEISKIFSKMIEKGEVDFDKINSIITKKIYKNAGISEDDLKRGISNPLNGKYSHYIASDEDADKEEKERLYEVIRTSSDGKFLEYISDENNTRGKVNKATKEEFQRAGLNFEAWDKYQIESEFDFRDNQKMKLKLWDRNPMEDLFIGNKTSCCTAIGAGNGFSTPIYLLNKCFNVIELLNDKGETVGMSRVFMANVDNKPALIIENIELNSNYKDGKTTREEKEKIRDEIFRFAKDYAKKVNNGVETSVYFSSNYTNVPTDDLETTKKTMDFIGSISENNDKEVYLNSYSGKINPKDLKGSPLDFYAV